MKYIQNTYRSDIQIIVKVDGRTKNYVFAHYQIDKISGQVISDGFTEVSDDDLKVLETNGAFKLLVEKGKLNVKDEAPLKAGSFEQLLDLKAKVKALEEENAALKAENAKLKAGGKPAKGKAGAKSDKTSAPEGGTTEEAGE